MSHDALANISSMSTREGGGNTNTNEQKGLSDEGLLQANATVIAGTLIFLTINSLAGSGGIGVPTIYITYVILFPFCLSSIFIVHGTALKNLNQRVAKWWSVWIQPKWWSTFGFVYLITILLILHLQGLAQFTTPAETCAINPGHYSIRASDCSRFSPGSLAEDCALNPYKFNVLLNQCHRFFTRLS